jgi:hypothetical protein
VKGSDVFGASRRDKAVEPLEEYTGVDPGDEFEADEVRSDFGTPIKSQRISSNAAIC